jgi:ribosomal protein S18 acetylase RimI-like enzyme
MFSSLVFFIKSYFLSEKFFYVLSTALFQYFLFTFFRVKRAEFLTLSFIVSSLGFLFTMHYFFLKNPLSDFCVDVFFHGILLLVSLFFQYKGYFRQNYKYVIMSFFATFFFGYLLGLVSFHVKLSLKKEKSTIGYLVYDKNKHFDGLLRLVMKYKFWIFHQDFSEGECPLFSYLSSGVHKNDFNISQEVPFYCTVALCDEKIVGFCSYYVCPFVFENKEAVWGRINILCVDEAYRRQGIARELSSQAMSFFKKKKATHAYLCTRPENTRARQLYYSIGFVDYDIEQKKGSINVYDTNPADYLVKEL